MVFLDDHGLEVIRKSGDELTPGSKTTYYLRTKVNNAVSEPVPVALVPTVSYDVKSVFDETLGVAALSEQTIVNYTVPVAKNAYLMLAEFNGSNYGTFRLYVDAVLNARKDTWIPGPFYGEFQYSAEQQFGILLLSGQTIELTCEHRRPYNGDFYGRFLLAEVDA